MARYLIEPTEPSMAGLKGNADTWPDALQAAFDLYHYYERPIAIHEVNEGVPTLRAVFRVDHLEEVSP